jgi:hypothetical protein
LALSGRTIPDQEIPTVREPLSSLASELIDLKTSIDAPLATEP